MEVNGYLITLGNCNKYMLKDFILSVIATTFVCCLCASCGITKMNTYRNGYIMDSSFVEDRFVATEECIEKLFANGQVKIRKIRDCCIFSVNDCEVFL